MAGSPPVRAGGETTLPQRFLRTGELLLCEMCSRNHRSELGGSHISREVIESGTVYEPITVVVSRFGIGNSFQGNTRCFSWFPYMLALIDQRPQEPVEDALHSRCSAQKHVLLAVRLPHSISCLPASCRPVTHARVRTESSSRDGLSRQRGRCSRSSLRPGRRALHAESRQGES